MVIGKREQKNPEQKLCAQVSMLCRQKLLGYAESFEELGRSFHDETRIVGDDRQSILEKCLLQQSRQVMGDHLTSGRRRDVLPAGRGKTKKKPRPGIA